MYARVLILLFVEPDEPPVGRDNPQVEIAALLVTSSDDERAMRAGDVERNAGLVAATQPTRLHDPHLADGVVIAVGLGTHPPCVIGHFQTGLMLAPVDGSVASDDRGTERDE